MADNPYQAAGVDTGALARIKDRIAGFARLTHGPEVLGGAGGFAGLFQLQGYDNPVLVASTDGVGTKLKVASLLGHYESLGIDLVNLNIDDVLTQGAKPLFFLDYVAASDRDLDWIDSLVRGMTWACREAGCALIGGETAQMPGVYAEGDFDLAGFIVGVVEDKHRLDSSTVEAGDVLVGVPSSGLHTNGFSLVRKVFDIDENPNVLYEQHRELGHSLGEELLIPHRSYYPALSPVLGSIKAMAHISGGGLLENMPRSMPPGVAARVHVGSWQVPPIFPMVQQRGNIDPAEMYRVFNMGLGMVMVCPQDRVEAVLSEVTDAVVVGEVVVQSGDDMVILDSLPK
ncbi:MAG: phosphoribosylformylglycinamidine cyclo-ligase [Dehalococcoidia bacterium]|nr:phosphoribosylformylglycinamidine cyclo-ligase [Dehalococcoidia bacterium]